MLVTVGTEFVAMHARLLPETLSRPMPMTKTGTPIFPRFVAAVHGELGALARLEAVRQEQDVVLTARVEGSFAAVNCESVVK